MARFLAAPAVQLLCRLLLGGVFVWASLDKIAHPGRFAAIIQGYGILPGWALNLFALTLPWLELVAGALLVLGLWRRPAALWLTALLLVFVVAIGYNVFQGIALDCGCFSTAGNNPESGLWLLGRDLLLLLPGLAVLFFDRRAAQAAG